MIARYPAEYTTLASVRTLKGMPTASTGDDGQIKGFIRQASSWIDLITKRHFMPYVQTKKFNPGHVHGLELWLNDDLLAVTSVTNGDSAAVTSDNYNLRPDNIDPKSIIEITGRGAQFWNFSYPEDRILIAGLWGYHTNYAVAWGNSLDTVEDNPLSSSAATLTVNDADGLDDRGLTRFNVGDYLLIGSEQLKVTSINTGTNALGIARAQNGSITAEHAQNTVIYVYRQLEDIQYCCNEMVKWMYDNRDTYQQRLQVLDIGVVIADELPVVNSMLAQYVIQSRFQPV